MMNDKSFNQIITAVERDGFSLKTLTMTFCRYPESGERCLKRIYSDRIGQVIIHL